MLARGLAPKWVHAGSSSSVDNPAQSSPWLVDLANSVDARAMVRCGIALYGYCSPITGADAASVPSKLRPALRPVMTWKTRVMDLRDLAAGETVGYNATFTAPAPMRLACFPWATPTASAANSPAQTPAPAVGSFCTAATDRPIALPSSAASP